MKIKIQKIEFKNIDYRRIKTLQGNLKILKSENYQRLKKSFAEKGMFVPCFVWLKNSDYFLLDGHGRDRLFNNEGAVFIDQNGNETYEIPCIVVDAEDLKDAKEKVLLISSQMQTMMPEGFDEFTFDIDGSWLKETIHFDAFNFEVPDFDPEEGLTDPDEVPDPPKTPITKPGDLWILGEHRLLCGDSTKKEDVERLMDGKKADMVFTDPPYNVDYGVSKNPRHKIRSIHQDNQTPKEWESFNEKIINNIKGVVDEGDIYVWGASGEDGMRQRLWFIDNDFHWSATIIWKKQQLVLSPAKYQRMYEPCLYGWFNKSSFVADRKQTEVWEIDRPLNSKLHPTMKPIDLCTYGIKNSSKVSSKVLDLFLGSGSTLIACEKTNRKCYGMEIDPHYCDVIVERWENFTGKKAKKK